MSRPGIAFLVLLAPLAAASTADQHGLETYLLRLADMSRRDVDAGGESEIRIHSLNGTPLHSETSAFTASGHLPADGLPFAPSYIEIPLAMRSENVRIDIIPLTPDLRFWAYASITNNVTQHVTLVTPP